MITVIRECYIRGKLHCSEELSSYEIYYPMDVILDIRDDAEINQIPRVMVSSDATFGKMDKSNKTEIARQRKFTAPKTYVRYILKTGDVT